MKLSELTRNASATRAPERLYEAFRVTLPRRRSLTEEEMRTYRRDGYVVCRNWFSPEEVGILAEAMQRDHHIDEQKIAVKDAEGRDTKLTLWWQMGDDTYSQFGRSASLVQAVSELMDGSEPYHSHTKVLLKEPGSGGAWEWHQDFGYWYVQGLLHPDKIINAVIAIDANTPDNGCMRLLRGSHSLGRLEHGTFGGQAGADPERVVAAMEMPNCEMDLLALQPGDLAFMHSNTLHASAPNSSKSWRRNMIVAYNSRFNEPVKGSPVGQPTYRPIDVVPDSSILTTGVRALDLSTNDLLAM